mmetsp:Transcript_16906/g.50670  ORF Transcript_16906/g.50670 Transcript_16906/m.50670 type:complete len:178 (-) Transcript_16906:560-1093(-)|eukprot:81641-Chlamydomonas_euryale.AAC.13
MAASEPQNIPSGGSGFLLPPGLPLAEAVSSPANKPVMCGGTFSSTSLESSATMSVAEDFGGRAAVTDRRTQPVEKQLICMEQQQQQQRICTSDAGMTMTSEAPGEKRSPASTKPRVKPVLLRNSASLSELLSPSWASSNNSDAGNTCPSAYIDPVAMYDEDRKNYIDGGQRISSIWE